MRVCEGEGSAALVEDVTSARIGEGGEMICMGGKGGCAIVRLEGRMQKGMRVVTRCYS